MSARGDSRSCGSVSHAGYSATESGSSKAPSAATRSVASRSVAVTASTGRPAPAGCDEASAGDDERTQRPRGTEVELRDATLSGPDGLRERRIFQQH